MAEPLLRLAINTHGTNIQSPLSVPAGSEDTASGLGAGGRGPGARGQGRDPKAGGSLPHSFIHSQQSVIGMGKSSPAPPHPRPIEAQQ